MANVFTNPLTEHLQSTRRRPDTDYQERLKQAQRIKAVANIMSLVGQGVFAPKGANILPMEDKVTPFAMNEFGRMREDEIKQGDYERQVGVNAMMKDIEYKVRAGERKEDQEYQAGRDQKADERYANELEYRKAKDIDAANERKLYNETPAQREARESRMLDKRYDISQKTTTTGKDKEYFTPGSIDWILSDKNRVDRYYSLVTADPKFKERFEKEYSGVASKLNLLGEDAAAQFKMGVIRQFHPEMFPEFYKQETQNVAQPLRNYPNYHKETLGTFTTPPGFRPGITPLPEQQKPIERTQAFNPEDPNTQKALKDAINKANEVVNKDYKGSFKVQVGKDFKGKGWAEEKAMSEMKKDFFDAFKNVPGITNDAIERLWNIANKSE